MLDGIDGRVARMIKGTSRFGAELDSLADFFNFGVAPGLILYFWGLHDLDNRRLDRRDGVRDLRRPAARALQRADRRSEPTGLGRRTSSPACRRRPAPSRCCCRSTLFLRADAAAALTGASTRSLIAGLMVSRLPVLSGKKMGTRVPPDLVLPVFVLVVLFIALLVSYPWHLLSVGTLLYLSACRSAGILSRPGARRPPRRPARPPAPSLPVGAALGLPADGGGCRSGRSSRASLFEQIGTRDHLGFRISAMSRPRVGLTPDLGYMPVRPPQSAAISERNAVNNAAPRRCPHPSSKRWRATTRRRSAMRWRSWRRSAG